MKPKTLDNLNLKGKKVLLRVDLNCGVFKGKIIESSRIKAHGKTIKELVRKNAKVVILAHQGNSGDGNFIGLRQHAKILNKYVNVKFINDTIGKKAINEINKLSSGEALLLENVRFLKEEFKPSVKNRFVQKLKPLFDYYINDAFSVCHRNQTSIVSFPKVLPSGIGRVMEEELKNIKKLKSKLKNCLFILGGKKTVDLIPLLKNRKILTGGYLSLLALISEGHDLGKENKILKDQLKLLPKIKKYSKNLKNPMDLAINFNGKRKVLDLEDFPQNYPVWGVGKKTIEMYKKDIKKARFIFLKGSLGKFQHEGFELGTKEILKSIAKSKAFSVIAGGQTSDALKKFHIDKNKFGYVSFSGGSLVKYLAGEKLIGLKALRI